MIENGYILQPRKIDDSDFIKSPPHVREIWMYLLRSANHKDTDNLKRGQIFTSYSKIIDALSWYVGYRKESYKKHHCEIAMKVLTKANMITTTKTTRGIMITICKYDYYQDPKNYENYTKTTKKTTTKLQSNDTINKNGNNEKNDEEINISFDTFWNLYDKKVGKKEKIETKWNKLKNKDREDIINYIPDYIASQPDKQFRKNPEVFLNNESWKDEIIGKKVNDNIQLYSYLAFETPYYNKTIEQVKQAEKQWGKENIHRITKQTERKIF